MLQLPLTFNGMLSVLMMNNSKYFLEGGGKLAFAVALTICEKITVLYMRVCWGRDTIM